MMVRPIDENDFDRRFPKGFGRSQTTKTAADDHDPRCLRPLLIRAIDRIEISFVHPFLLKLLRPEISENLGFSRRPRWSGQRRTDGSVLIQILLTEWRRIFNPFCHVASSVRSC